MLNRGAVLLKNIKEDQTVSLLWEETKDLPEIKNFQRFTLGLDFLFSLGLIELEKGIIKKRKK